MQWKVCGIVSSSGANAAVKTSSNLRAGASAVHPRTHYIRHSRMLKKSASSSGDSNNGDPIVSYGADGYPCGLWFLFHYLSGIMNFPVSSIFK